jgi:hypothetical protein
MQSMASNSDSVDTYEIADAPLREKEQRLIKELDGVRAARASIAVAREMAGGVSAQPTNPHPVTSVASTVINSITGTPYYGLGLAEAGIKCLSLRYGHPRTVKYIWKVLSESGVKILSEKPESALGWAFRKRERKVGDVILVGNGEWGLPNWYTPVQLEQIKASRNNASGRNREEHIERTKAGMELAHKLRGVKIGAARKMTPEVIARAEELLSQGRTIRQVADELGVATSSISGNGLRARALRKRGTELRLVK